MPKKEHIFFNENHCWIQLQIDNTEIPKVTIGITQYAQQELGEIVFLESYAQPKDWIKQGETIISLESVKSVSDVCSPITGELISLNTKMIHDLSLINNSPMKLGWIASIRLHQFDELKSMMNEETYLNFINKSI